MYHHVDTIKLNMNHHHHHRLDYAPLTSSTFYSHILESFQTLSISVPEFQKQQVQKQHIPVVYIFHSGSNPPSESQDFELKLQLKLLMEHPRYVSKSRGGYLFHPLLVWIDGTTTTTTTTTTGAGAGAQVLKDKDHSWYINSQAFGRWEDMVMTEVLPLLEHKILSKLFHDELDDDGEEQEVLPRQARFCLGLGRCVCVLNIWAEYID